jgi:hypothetical protein
MNKREEKCPVSGGERNERKEEKKIDHLSFFLCVNK